MNNLRQEFEERVEEISLYYTLLEILEKGDCDVQCKTILGIVEQYSINPNLIRILKANGFILLYNLVESTIRKSTEVILQSIHREGVTYGNMTEKIKKIWILHHTIPLKKGIDSLTSQRISELMNSVADNIINQVVLKLDSECIKINGNIDAQQIRSIADQFGFERCTDGSQLLTVKEKRNILAHGEKTFGDVGKDYTVRELIDFKDKTIDYLLKVMTNIEKYIFDRMYMQQN